MIFSLIKKVLQKSISIEHRKLILIGFTFIGLSSFIMYFLEPKEFKNPFNGFWYVMTIVSQVGVGDYIPKTILGKLYTVFMYIVGVGLFAVIIAKFIDFMNKYEQLKEAEILGFKGENHIVMINWSQKTKITIEEILNKNQGVEIVLIDNIGYSPMKHNNLHYVQGNPTKIDTLSRANVLNAESICIFAADNPLDQTAEDGKSLLIAATIKYMAQTENISPYIITEIFDEDHISNTNQDHVDQFILSNKPFSSLMATTALESR